MAFKSMFKNREYQWTVVIFASMSNFGPRSIGHINIGVMTTAKAQKAMAKVLSQAIKSDGDLVGGAILQREIMGTNVPTRHI